MACIAMVDWMDIWTDGEGGTPGRWREGGREGGRPAVTAATDGATRGGGRGRLVGDRNMQAANKLQECVCHAMLWSSWVS